jgi:hypothetical protein
LCKSCQKGQNSDFQSQFSVPKIIQIFLRIFLIIKYDFRSTLFVIDIFWKLQFLNHLLYFLKSIPIFDDFYSIEHKTQKLSNGWLLVLCLKECLVECATLYVKSEVILIGIGYVYIYKLLTKYRGSPLSTIFGTWKKLYYAKFVLVE